MGWWSNLKSGKMWDTITDYAVPDFIYNQGTGGWRSAKPGVSRMRTRQEPGSARQGGRSLDGARSQGTPDKMAPRPGGRTGRKVNVS